MSLSPLPKPVLAQLTRRFGLSLAQITTLAAPQLQALWAKLPGYDEAQIAEFERRAGPIIATAKQATVHHAAGFYALAAGIRPPSITPNHVDVTPDLRGPFIQTWSALKHGDTEDGAIAAGFSRVEAMAANFVASASRLTGDAVYSQANVEPQGWQREPEGNACDWCLEMAQNTYRSADSCDFGHDRCQCIAVPAF